MSLIESFQNKVTPDALLGRPEFYPVLDGIEGLVFYIQRSQNINTVIYTLNLLPGDILNVNEPLSISWIRYDNEGNITKQPLNYIQKSLAYGYSSKFIHKDLIEFSFLPYSILKFYLARKNNKDYQVYTTLDNKLMQVTSAYVHTEDMGIFPQVKFIDIFGYQLDSVDQVAHRIVFD